MAVAAGAPFNLGADHVNDLVGQAGNVLVAEVDGDARLLLQFARGGVGGGAVGDVLAGVLEGGLGEGHDLVVRDGRRRVVAHGERARGRPGDAAAWRVADMLLCPRERTATMK